MRLAVSCILALLLASTGLARILDVPAEYPTIQAGINASVNGDTVLVAPGEYAEDSLVIQDKNILLTGAEGPNLTRINGRIRIMGTLIDSTCIFRGFLLNGAGVIGWPDYLVMLVNSSPIVWGNIYASGGKRSGLLRHIENLLLTFPP